MVIRPAPLRGFGAGSPEDLPDMPADVIQFHDGWPARLPAVTGESWAKDGQMIQARSPYVVTGPVTCHFRSSPDRI